MLRKDLPPLDSYLADAISLERSVFFARHPWPVLVIPEPDPKIMARLIRPDTLIHYDDETVMLSDPSSPRMSGASLDALVLEVRPKPSSTPARITIGRAPEADVVLIDETISRMHAEMSWDPDHERASLTDLGGRNGTTVDGTKLKPRGKTSLIPGSVVLFGALATRFYSPTAFLAWLQTGAPRAGAAPGTWPPRPAS
jgi:hypothetical protein